MCTPRSGAALRTEAGVVTGVETSQGFVRANIAPTVNASVGGNLTVRGLLAVVATHEFDPATLAVRSYGAKDGVALALYWGGSCGRTAQGEMVFATALSKRVAEWISSVILENVAMGHPAIAHAAVIGVPHSRWLERPLLICVRRGEATGDRGVVDRDDGREVGPGRVPGLVCTQNSTPSMPLRPAAAAFHSDSGVIR